MVLLYIVHSSISSTCIWSCCCHRLRLIALLPIPYSSISRNCEHSHLLLCFFLDLCHFLSHPYFFILVCVFQASLNIILLTLASTTDMASTCQTFSGDNESIISTEATLYILPLPASSNLGSTTTFQER